MRRVPSIWRPPFPRWLGRLQEPFDRSSRRKPPSNADSSRGQDARRRAASADVDREAGDKERTRGRRQPRSYRRGPSRRTEAPEAGSTAEARRRKVLGTDAEGCTEVFDGRVRPVVVGDQDTTAQARAAAVEQARRRRAGLSRSGRRSKFMDFQQERPAPRRSPQGRASSLQTTRNGRIMKEKLGRSGLQGRAGLPDSCRYHVKPSGLRAAPGVRIADKDFQRGAPAVAREVRDRATRRSSRSPGGTRDCSVYLYDVYDLAADNKVAAGRCPNEAVPPQVVARPAETWGVSSGRGREEARRAPGRGAPDDSDRRRMSAETILVVATKTPLPAAVYDPSDGGYLGVFRRLHHSKTEWAEDAGVSHDLQPVSAEPEQAIAIVGAGDRHRRARAPGRCSGRTWRRENAPRKKSRRDDGRSTPAPRSIRAKERPIKVYSLEGLLRRRGLRVSILRGWRLVGVGRCRAIPRFTAPCTRRFFRR